MTSGYAPFVAIPTINLVRDGCAASGLSGASLFLAMTAWKSIERLVRFFIAVNVNNVHDANCRQLL